LLVLQILVSRDQRVKVLGFRCADQVAVLQIAQPFSKAVATEWLANA
jgi:hypothetical protein